MTHTTKRKPEQKQKMSITSLVGVPFVLVVVAFAASSTNKLALAASPQRRQVRLSPSLATTAFTPTTPKTQRDDAPPPLMTSSSASSSLPCIPPPRGITKTTALFVSSSSSHPFSLPSTTEEEEGQSKSESVVNTVDWDWKSVASSVFDSDDQRPIILFDGMCNLCNGGVNFALDNDDTGHFRFVSLQSKIGKSLLLRSDRNPNDINSIVLITPRKAYFKSEALIRIALRLNGPYLPLIGYAGRLVPKSVRNDICKFVAENRYRFGEYDGDSCRLYDDRFDDRFIPDP